MPPAPPPIPRCDACFKEIENDDVFCAYCGYPIKGTKVEQSAFILKQNKIDYYKAEIKKKVENRIDKGATTLFCLSGLFILAAIIGFFKLQDNPQVLAFVIPYLILGIIFLLLGEYSKKKPLMCFVSGLCLYIIAELYDISERPQASPLGIITIFIIIVFLVLGIKSAVEIEKIKKENNIS